MSTLAIFVDQPRCSVQSANGIINALHPEYRFKIFTRHTVENDFFQDVDGVVIPGGVGDSDSYDRIMINHAQRLRNYVDNGGVYIGICMGAYWAGKYYLNLLQDIEVQQYIQQPGSNTRRPHPKAMPVIWQNQETQMYFYDGAAFIGNGDCKIYARYKTGHVMALQQNRVGVIGCHPESQPHWYQTHSWMRNHWHHGRHHAMLKQFVKDLLNNS